MANGNSSLTATLSSFHQFCVNCKLYKWSKDEWESNPFQALVFVTDRLHVDPQAVGAGAKCRPMQLLALARSHGALDTYTANG